MGGQVWLALRVRAEVGGFVNLQYPFYKFPCRFDAERLRSEIDALPQDCWRWHHQDFKGNSALHLITTNGGINDDFEAPMMPTEHLTRLPYTMQVLGWFQTLLGRARLMRLEPGDGVPIHADLQYYWRRRTRVHIPVFTDPAIRFHCGNQSVHMAPGEAWTFNNWLMHKVVNETSTRRIHLTFDTVGNSAFWALARPFGSEHPAQFVPYQEGAAPELSFETYVEPPVVSPSEVEMDIYRFLTDIAAHPQNDKAAVSGLRRLLLAFCDDWRATWYGQGPTERNIPAFDAVLRRTAREANAFAAARLVMASNGSLAGQALSSILLALLKTRGNPASVTVSAGPRFEQPVIIVAAPRSGSTLLFETLAANGAFWTLGGEGAQQVESIATLDPQSRGIQSNRLTAADAGTEVCAQLLANYIADLRDVDQARWRDMGGTAPASVRFLEKTPKNALRIPFFKAMFPDAKFIFLHREAKANISAIIDAWRSGRFITYPNLPAWKGPPWSLLLTPDWRELIGAELGRIAMRQWRDTNEIILGDLSSLPSQDWCSVRYEDLVRDPAQTVRRLCAFAGVEFTERMQTVTSSPLKLSRFTLTEPNTQKWRRNEAEFAPFLDEAQSTIDRLAALSGETTEEE